MDLYLNWFSSYSPKRENFRFRFLLNLKKKTRENDAVIFIMDGDSKKPLKIVITDFYKLHKAKGKEYTFKQFKKFGVHKATIYRWLKKIEQNGNCDRKSGV